jgi:hypothetical protein
VKYGYVVNRPKASVLLDLRRRRKQAHRRVNSKRFCTDAGHFEAITVSPGLHVVALCIESDFMQSQNGLSYTAAFR